MASQEVLEQLCENCNPEYCTIREFLKQCKKQYTDCKHYADNHEFCENILYLIAKNQSDRLMLQFKCVEELRWIRGEELGRELTWDESWMMWCDGGYAEKFAEIYESGVRDIYFFFREGTVPQRKHEGCLSTTFEKAKLITGNSSAPSYA